MCCCCAGRDKKVGGVFLIVRVLIYVLGFCLLVTISCFSVYVLGFSCFCCSICLC